MTIYKLVVGSWRVYCASEADARAAYAETAAASKEPLPPFSSCLTAFVTTGAKSDVVTTLNNEAAK